MDGLEQLLEKEQFLQALPVILADNGMEFLSPSLIETSIYGGHRTLLYYFDSLSQEKLLLAVNHINNYSRVSLNGKTAFDIAALLFNLSFFEKLGLEKVHPDEVCLTTSPLR